MRLHLPADHPTGMTESPGRERSPRGEGRVRGGRVSLPGEIRAFFVPRAALIGLSGTAGPHRPEPVRPGRRSGTEREAIADKKLRVNDEIRISPVRLIDDAGEQVGIVSLDDARERARETGLDLVEVAPEARPPVVKLIDHGKWRYEQAKAAQEARRHQHQTQIKEVKFRPGIGKHDYEFKARHARRFLESGNKVKLTMQFRGRQMSHPEIGREILERLVGELADAGVAESDPTLEGRFMTLMVAPRKTAVKKKSS